MKHRSALGLALAAAIALAASACGDDSPTLQDGGSGSNPSATFTDYVIDLVKNHTADPTPMPFATFMALPDPDGDNNNVHAYDSLFQ